jgi:hypothetical protein
MLVDDGYGSSNARLEFTAYKQSFASLHEVSVMAQSQSPACIVQPWPLASRTYTSDLHLAS